MPSESRQSPPRTPAAHTDAERVDVASTRVADTAGAGVRDRSDASREPGRSLVVWQILDSRPGHRNQVLGLAEALARQTAAEPHTIEVDDGLRGLRGLLPGRLRRFRTLPRPDLLIAAGHATHFPLLCLQRRFGGRSVVLMKPSLPLPCFDVCLIPDSHSFRRRPRNVELTQGALNRIRPRPQLDSPNGLLLIGGPSAHFGWSDAGVLSQVEDIVRCTPSKHWTVATSRRTPAAFPADCRARGLPAELVRADHTTPDWLPARLADCDTVWVTADSVSMLYEALTAGAAVGVLELPGDRSTRVSRSVSALRQRRQVIAFRDWQQGTPLTRTATPLQEADRCAALILDRFLADNRRTSRAA